MATLRALNDGSGRGGLSPGIYPDQALADILDVDISEFEQGFVSFFYRTEAPEYLIPALNKALYEIYEIIQANAGGGSGLVDGSYGDIQVSTGGTVMALRSQAVHGLAAATLAVDDELLIASEANTFGLRKATLEDLTTFLAGTFMAVNSELESIASLAAANDDIIQRKAGVWTNRTPAQFKADLGLSKADVGLSDVSNVDTTTTANIADSTDKRFVTDADLTVLDNTSGVNSGDETGSTISQKAHGFILARAFLRC